jgi:hypothetical protein
MLGAEVRLRGHQVPLIARDQGQHRALEDLIDGSQPCCSSLLGPATRLKLRTG